MNMNIRKLVLIVPILFLVQEILLSHASPSLVPSLPRKQLVELNSHTSFDAFKFNPF